MPPPVLKSLLQVSRSGVYLTAEQRGRTERDLRFACTMSNYVSSPVRVVYFAIDYIGGRGAEQVLTLETIQLSSDNDNCQFANIARHLRSWLQADN